MNRGNISVCRSESLSPETHGIVANLELGFPSNISNRNTSDSARHSTDASGPETPPDRSVQCVRNVMYIVLCVLAVCV